MIRVRVHRDAQGRIHGFTVRGHSGYAPRGQDIVCAGVSALTEATVGGLTRRLGLAPPERMEDGEISWQDPRAAELESAQVLLWTMVDGLREVAAAYPRHVSVSEQLPGDGQKDGEKRKGGRQA